jgi:hypothetical protein
MTSKPKRPAEVLTNLIEVLSDEVMAKPDADILSEAAAEHGNLDAHITTLKFAVESRVAAERKERLIQAQAALKQARMNDKAKVAGRPLPRLKEMARALFEQRAEIPERLTLAFRSGESMSDEDWATLIDDLVEIGFLSDE